MKMLASDGEDEIDMFTQKMEDLLSSSQYIGVPPDPTNVLGHVYIGTQANAENFDLLKRWRITHVLNCAGTASSDSYINSVFNYRLSLFTQTCVLEYTWMNE